MSTRDEWEEQIEKWKHEYGDPSEDLKTIDLTRIRLNKICAKKNCRSKHNLSRHHKGHEYLFAVLLPHVHARRYLEFRPDDCVLLCDLCHRLIHHSYLQPIRRMNNEAAYLSDKQKAKVYEGYRQDLIIICEYWVTRPFTTWEKNVRSLWKEKKRRLKKKKAKKKK